MKTPLCLATFLAVHFATAQTVTFEQDIRPIFETSCVSCHGPRKQKGGVRLDRRDGFSDFVTPGDADASRLLAIVSGKIRLKRNASDHVLSAEQVALIRAWIDSGAK